VTTKNAQYRNTLLEYFEEEVMGEIYFRELMYNFSRDDERKKLTLLANVERTTAEILHPIIDRYGLIPRSDAELEPLAAQWTEQRKHLNWQGLMQGMVTEYPVYVDLFKKFETQAPQRDIPALKRLTAHEIALVDFAKLEIAGNPDSLMPIHDFLGISFPTE